MGEPPYPVEGVLPAPLAPIVRRVAQRFPESWLVGGAVRDRIMGRRPADFDLAVVGDPVDFFRREANAAGLGFVLLDPDRRIARIVVKEPRLTLDAAPLEGGSLAADLARRDFTVNAIALRLTDSALIDPFDGATHCRQRLLRGVSPTLFADDPARLLRLYRLAATHDLAPDDRTRALVREQGELLGRVAKERLWQEISRLFAVPCASVVARMADDRLLDRLFPALASGRGMTQNRWHHLDVFAHALETLRRLDEIVADPTPLGIDAASLNGRLREEIGYAVPRAVALRLAALLHDVGKPACRTENDGVVRFLQHEQVGADEARRLLRAAGAPNVVIEGVAHLVINHLRPLNGLHDGTLTRRAAWRYGRSMGVWLPEGVVLAWADAMATNGPAVTPARREHERQALIGLLRDDAVTTKPTRLLDGDAVMRLTGLPPGKLVGALLAALEEAVGVGEVTTVEEAERFVRERL